MDDQPDVATLILGLVSDSESARKYAVFKLQTLLNDASFADAFIQGDGLLPLRQAVLEASGNTQAYAFGSLDALLELDMGWEVVDAAIIEKAVALAVAHPLVNLVRNVLTLLVLIVSRPLRGSKRDSAAVFGFRAIKPALEDYPSFLGSLVQRLSASDHTLCANALQLVNALMRDAVAHGGEHEWPKFIKRLQDLGVIGGVGMLMRGDAASDAGTPLAAAILEFQGLTKLLLRKWKEVKVNTAELPEHKRALKTIHLLSRPEPYHAPEAEVEAEAEGEGAGGGERGRKGNRKHHPHKWRRLGFETESPAWEFDETGYLGMMDLVDYARRNEDAYHKTILEQSVHPPNYRCPLARSSLSVTLILYEHFEIDQAEDMDDPEYGRAIAEVVRQGQAHRLFRPLLLQWGRLHTAALHAFLRIWKAAGAELDDFYKMEEVVRVVVERIVGASERKTDVAKVEEQLRGVTLATARQWQMEGLDEIYEEAWGPHLGPVREQLHYESLQFMKEQRIRCLLQGCWFPVPAAGDGDAPPPPPPPPAWRFVRLSHNRRWLHHATYPSPGATAPELAELRDKIDLNTVTSVDSDVSAGDPAATTPPRPDAADDAPADAARRSVPADTTTTITIMGTPAGTAGTGEEGVLLELCPPTSHQAAEWLDGLLMLLNQQPITKDTTRLIDMMEDWGVRLRLLNLRSEDVDWEALQSRGGGEEGNGVEAEAAAVPSPPPPPSAKPVPSRVGLDADYWYAMPET